MKRVGEARFVGYLRTCRCRYMLRRKRPRRRRDARAPSGNSGLFTTPLFAVAGSKELDATQLKKVAGDLGLDETRFDGSRPATDFSEWLVLP